jgi:uncharacterized protein (DUF1778 family)
MARPKKNPALLMDVDLRIPMTSEQKKLISAAAAMDQADVAAWVRPILLKAAHGKIAKKDDPKSKH